MEKSDNDLLMQAPPRAGHRPRVFSKSLGRTLVLYFPIGFFSFLVAAIYLLPESSAYLLHLPYWISISSAVLLVLLGKNLVNQITDVNMAGKKNYLAIAALYGLLAILLSSFGWLIAASLARIYAIMVD